MVSTARWEEREQRWVELRRGVRMALEDVISVVKMTMMASAIQ